MHPGAQSSRVLERRVM